MPASCWSWTRRAQAAQDQGLTLEYWGAHSGAEVDAALVAIDGWKPDAVLVFAGVVASSHADRFAAWSLRRRVPTVSAWAAFAEAGNLMTYGPVIGEAPGPAGGVRRPHPEGRQGRRDAGGAAGAHRAGAEPEDGARHRRGHSRGVLQRADRVIE